MRGWMVSWFCFAINLHAADGKGYLKIPGRATFRRGLRAPRVALFALFTLRDDIYSQAADDFARIVAGIVDEELTGLCILGDCENLV